MSSTTDTFFQSEVAPETAEDDDGEEGERQQAQDGKRSNEREHEEAEAEVGANSRETPSAHDVGDGMTSYGVDPRLVEGASAGHDGKIMEDEKVAEADRSAGGASDVVVAYDDHFMRKLSAEEFKALKVGG